MGGRGRAGTRRAGQGGNTHGRPRARRTLRLESTAAKEAVETRGAHLLRGRKIKGEKLLKLVLADAPGLALRHLVHDVVHEQAAIVPEAVEPSLEQQSELVRGDKPVVVEVIAAGEKGGGGGEGGSAVSGGLG